MSFNELISDETIAIDKKKEITNNRVNDYLEDMNNLVYTSLKMVEKRAFVKAL